ncbi:S-layer homology domain-containing protein [Paenibacillus sp. 598K]|uniref:S-layer homology domain-containing protein n=1 Tax=Paenibacillus sp. 598K TaxID=1117987 RepID=UPI0016264D44|nr:S-layer homology domain-containing protein [Paenibacillus sp. 598K]
MTDGQYPTLRPYVSDADSVAAAKPVLQIGYTAGDSDTSVTGNLTLPTTGLRETTVSWTSSHPSVVTTAGTVTRPSYLQGDLTVKLTATIAKNFTSETKEFNVTVIALPQTDAEAVAAAKSALVVGYIIGDSASSVTANVTLPTTGASDTAISWSSSDTSVIAMNGAVARPSYDTGDQVVTLTATITKGTESDTKVFTLTVKALPESDIEAVASAKKALAIGYMTGDSKQSVTGDVTLPTAGVSGTTISWASSDTSVVATNGTVTRPTYGMEDQVVTLTATITKGTASNTRTFTVTVKVLPQTDAQAVAAAKNALVVGYITGDSANSVTADVTLPTTGASDTAISWSSSDTSVIATNGAVARPSYNMGDQLVTLTATITKGTESDTQEFKLTVKALPQTDAEAVAAAKNALVVGYITGDSASSVTANVTLPTTGASDTAINWSSSDTSVIAPNGAVARPSYDTGDQIITLIATITKGTESDTQEFTLTVKALPESDIEAVASAKKALAIGYITGDSASSVTANVTLTATGASDTAISWSSSDANVIATNGTVARPTYGTGDQIITLIATITKGTESDTQEFTLTVKALPETDAEAIVSDKNKLTVGYSEGDTANHVTGELTLPTTGASDTAISWSSSDAGIVAANGAVTRPSYAQGDQIVTLTATITKGAASDTKTFTVTVKALAQTDQEAVALVKGALEIGYASGDSASSVVSGLTLPTTGASDTVISWSSSQPSVIAADGAVTRPSYTQGDQTITLTATIAKGEATDIKTFTVTVKAAAAPNNNNVYTPLPVPNTEQINVDIESGNGTNLAKTPITRTTQPDGTQSDRVSVTDAIAKQMTEKAKETGVNVARIVIPDANDRVSEVRVDVPRSAVQQLREGNLQLEIATVNARIAIPAASLTGFADDLYFRIVPIKDDAEKRQVAERITEAELVTEAAQDRDVRMLGRPMSIETNVQNREVSIILPLKEGLPTDPTERQEMLNNLHIFVEHSDGTKELLQGTIVEAADGSEAIEFTVTRFSTFSVLYMERLVEEEPATSLTAYINGFADGTFRPDQGITRAEMAAILARTVAVGTGAEANFSDLQSTHWAYDEIQQVIQSGLMKGYPDGQFKPDQRMTRAELAAIAFALKDLSAAAGYSYTDTQHHWAEQMIEAVRTAGLMNGYPDGSFRPNNTVTRAEVVVFMNRLLDRGVAPAASVQTWSDVSPDHWAFEEIEAASATAN